MREQVSTFSSVEIKSLEKQQSKQDKTASLWLSDWADNSRLVEQTSLWSLCVISSTFNE